MYVIMDKDQSGSKELLWTLQDHTVVRLKLHADQIKCHDPSNVSDASANSDPAVFPEEEEKDNSPKISVNGNFPLPPQQSNSPVAEPCRNPPRN